MLDMINQIKPIDKKTIDKKNILYENVINFIIRSDDYLRYIDKHCKVNDIATKIVKKGGQEIIKNIVIATKTIIQNKQAEIINQILIQSLKKVYEIFEDCLSYDVLITCFFKEIDIIEQLFTS